MSIAFSHGIDQEEEDYEEDYVDEFPPFQVGWPDEDQMIYEGEIEAANLTRERDATLVQGTRGKRRQDSEGNRAFRCFYCLESSTEAPFYVPNLLANKGTVFTRAFCLPECGLGWVIHEFRVSDLIKDATAMAIMDAVGRAVKCPRPPLDMLCRDLGGLMGRKEAVIDTEDYAPQYAAQWREGRMCDDDDNQEPGFVSCGGGGGVCDHYRRLQGKGAALSTEKDALDE